MHDFTWVRTGLRYRGIPHRNPGRVLENVIHMHHKHFELVSNGTVFEIPASVAKIISLDERLLILTSTMALLEVWRRGAENEPERSPQCPA
jgi:hypothetical protein